ncbi:MAG: sigma-54-dependent Fis family transcriptional regulator [Bradymonadales bacterium]|nr:sigma-54-dependent Fis family transcriptional regulator [Bradymonadales bacterium]
MNDKRPSTTRILVVDDDAPSRQVVCEILGREGYQVEMADSGDSALALHQEEPFDLVVSDIRMPGRDGLDLMRELKRSSRPPLIILITAFGDMDGAAQALQGGAFEYLSKPFRPSELKATVARAVTELQSVDSIGPSGGDSSLGLIGRSPAMIRLYREVARASSSDATVLVVGESGSGKELVARAIHNYSPRKTRPFVAVNCGALTETLLESELFGHVKGAFTGADANRKGLFEEANAGTLLLDEIGEVSPRMQAQLLRVLQEREIRPVGASHSVTVDTRVVAATNRDLEEMVKNGQFREELLYRINVVVIEVPPLRERQEDIPYLVQHFLARHGCDQRKQIDVEALNALIQFPWPGNVRQLENMIARALALTPGDRITLADLPPEVSSTCVPATSRKMTALPSTTPKPIQTLSELNRAYALEVLDQVGGNKSKAAELLGIDRKTLYRLLKE